MKGLLQLIKMEQIEKMNKDKFPGFFFAKNRRGVSIVVGYVLLVAFVIIMGSIVYQWIGSFVPREIMDCPEEVSIFVKDVDCESRNLSLTLQNNGRFNIDGYFIRATNEPNQTLATMDLSEFFDEDAGDKGKLIENKIVFGLLQEENSFKPNSEPVTHVFNLDSLIYSIEVIPIRYQLENNKKRFVSCGNSKIRENVECS